jgi:hypothetical protein
VRHERRDARDLPGSLSMMKSRIVLIGLVSVVATGCAAQTKMFVDPTNPNRYARCWSEGAGLDAARIVASTQRACEEKANALGLRPVEEKPGRSSRKSLVVPLTILRTPDGTDARCEATAATTGGALFELPGGTYLVRAAKAERECIERLKRQGYKPVWHFEQAAAR